MRLLAILMMLSAWTAVPVWAQDDPNRCESTGIRTKDKSVTMLEGRVVRAGPSIYMEGSHLLLDGSGEKIARLEGGQLDLSNLEGRWLKILGNWRSTVEAGGKIFQVSGIVPLEPSSSNP